MFATSYISLMLVSNDYIINYKEESNHRREVNVVNKGTHLAEKVTHIMTFFND